MLCLLLCQDGNRREKVTHMQQRSCCAAQPGERTDGILVGLALAGDERAFETLVQRYDASLFACIYRYLGDYDQACDVLQDVRLQLYRSLPTLRTGEPLGPWLLRVTRNRCLDALRRRRRRCVLYFSDLGREGDEEEWSSLASLPDSHPLPEEVAEYHELQHALQQAIQALPPTSRTVVLLRSAGQLSFAEIGRILQMPGRTAKSFFYRARPRLAVLLAEQRQANHSCRPILVPCPPETPGHSKEPVSGAHDSSARPSQAPHRGCGMRCCFTGHLLSCSAT